MTREEKLDLAEAAIERFFTEAFNKGESYTGRELAEVVLDAMEGKPTTGTVQ